MAKSCGTNGHIQGRTTIPQIITTAVFREYYISFPRFWPLLSNSKYFQLSLSLLSFPIINRYFVWGLSSKYVLLWLMIFEKVSISMLSSFSQVASFKPLLYVTSTLSGALTHVSFVISCHARIRPTKCIFFERAIMQSFAV